MFFLLSFLWFIREIKALLFWFYLWQLKEYHLGRFLDHFRTEKGRKLFSNSLLFLKIALLFFAFFLSFSTKLLFWQLYASWIVILMIFYLFEFLKFFQDLFKKTLKKPALTPKALILISVALIIEFLFLYILFQKFYFVLFKNFYWFAFSLLTFDILTPFIASIIVFSVHPFTIIFFRNPIIKKAKQKRAKFKNLLVIGICGSYGKTSTKEFLSEILSERVHPVKSAEGGLAKREFNRVKVLKTKENQNSEVGISQCILKDLKAEHEIFVCEMGAYNRGGIKLLCDIVIPKIGIITGVNEQHLATFGNMENLLSAEGGKELVESLPGDGMVFFNARNKYCQNLYQKVNIKKFLYGETAKIFGEENLLGAMAVAKELGMTNGEISKAVKKIENKLPGIQQKKGAGGLIIFDATYSANPDGVIAHLEHLKTLPGPEGRAAASYGVNKKIIIMPCLIELGRASKEVHRRIGQKIGEICDLAIITTKERFNDIKTGAMEKGMRGECILFLENPKIILEKIKPYLKPENIILLEGRISQKLIEILLKKSD